MSNYAVTNESQFSQSYLDLQKAGFCCSGSASDKIIRWVGCTPGVYKGSSTVFSSTDIGLCTWFQAITEYSYQTIVLSPGEVVEAAVDAEFLMIKIKWPSAHESGVAVLESEKIMELGLNGQAGYVGQTIPFPIGVPSPADYRHLVVKDLFIANAKSAFVPKIKFNNIAASLTATVGVFAAK